ncbi:MAG: hypothetical protein JWL60_1675 [Gemmatimonadetes bacterium]|jgi:hypothetical protein|nr:hypothetical protein [Gemmatimonadota bacterium]
MSAAARVVTPHAEPSYGAAAVVGAVVLLLYAATLAPTTALWDASEYITAAYTLGIPHPPGNPLFILLGRVASLVPVGGVAVRINMLAAVCSAFSCAVWFLVAERVLSSWFPLRWTRLLGAGVAALLSATAFTVWNQSVVNEKVYTVSLAFFAVVSWLTVLWCDDPDGRRADRLLVLVAYLIGLGYTNHPAGFLVGPAVGVAVLARRPSTLLRWRLLLAAALALMFGLTPFAVLPIRAAHHPAMNQGETTGCTGTIGLACTFSGTTADRLAAHVNREQYGKPDLAQRQAPFTAQVGMWWLYFKWQWLRDSHGTQPGTQAALAVLFLALGIAGGVVHWRHDRASFWFFGPLVVTVTIVLVYYMNFKYGASQAPELTGVEREVRDRDYFYLWSYSAWSVWAALGLAACWRAIADRVRIGGARRWVTAAPVLLLGLVPLLGNWRDASRAGETAPREWARDLLNSVEPYGILVTLGDNDTFPLWYAQQVEGVRPDVTVAVTSLLNTDWYIRSLMRQPIVRYDAARGPAVYRGREWPMPRTPILSMSVDQVDAIPEYVEVRTPQLFQAGQIRAIVDPAKLEFGVPVRSDILVLQMLKDNLGVRPLYLARTSGGYVSALGLEAYALSQGLATKIMPAPIAPSPGIVPVRGLGHLDVARTRALYDGFGAPRAIIARGDWVDRPSVGIALTYISIALLMGDVLDQAGATAEAERFRRTGVDVAQATRTLDLFMDPAAGKGPGGTDAPRGTPLPATP